MSKPGVLLIVDRKSSWYTALEETFLRTLKQIGNHADAVFFDVNVRVYRVVYEFSPWYNDRYLRSAQREVLVQVKKSQCEVVLVVKGFFLLPETILEIKAMNKRVYCFNPDDPFELEFGTSNRNIRNCIPHYDAYFIWSKRLIKEIGEAGCSMVHYMPFGVDSEIIKVVSAKRIEEEREYDLSFIGNPDDKRSRVIKDLGSNLDNKKLRNILFGLGWKKMNGFENGSFLQGDTYMGAMYNSKVNLNILRDQNIGSHNMRTFEIPATGSFMLHEESDEAKDFFEPGVEAEFYTSIEECADKVAYYVKNENARIKIAKAGYERTVKSKYYYTEIMRKMLEAMEQGR